METNTYSLKVVNGYKVYSKTGEIIGEEYTDRGFSRGLLIYEGDTIIHSSGLGHPERQITTNFKNREFLVLPNSDEVYIKTINNEVDLGIGLNYEELSIKFDQLLKDVTKQDFMNF